MFDRNLLCGTGVPLTSIECLLITSMTCTISETIERLHPDTISNIVWSMYLLMIRWGCGINYLYLAPVCVDSISWGSYMWNIILWHQILPVHCFLVAIHFTLWWYLSAWLFTDGMHAHHSWRRTPHLSKTTAWLAYCRKQCCCLWESSLANNSKNIASTWQMMLEEFCWSSGHQATKWVVPQSIRARTCNGRLSYLPYSRCHTSLTDHHTEQCSIDWHALHFFTTVLTALFDTDRQTWCTKYHIHLTPGWPLWCWMTII